MKKVININFKGRVIPIEEAAFEQLQRYTESLRRYFANEEGRDEIINDIENRIAELFNEKLKISGVSFISEAHVEAIIASMGRPEQFEEPVSSTTSTSSTPSTSSTLCPFPFLPYLCSRNLNLFLTPMGILLKLQNRP